MPPHVTAAKGMLERIEAVILFPLMSLMMAIAFLVFLYGAYEYVVNSGSDEGRSKGKTHMIYGIIGFLVMISALAILRIAAGTFGIALPQ